MKNFILTAMAILLSFGSFATLLPMTPSSGGVCIGSVMYISDTMSPGGTWSSSDLAVGTIGTSGALYGISAGVVTVTYTVGSSFVTGTFTVSPVPASITGPGSVCAGSNITLADATPGGVWSTSAYTGTATMSPSTGILTGVSPGVVFVYYTVGGGCQVETLDTVTGATAGTIYGPTTVCPGSTIDLGDSTLGGVTSSDWSSSNTAVATIGSTGMVTGVSTGTTTISLGYAGSCGTVYATYIVTVTTGSVGPISGPTSITAGVATGYASLPSGGTWSISPSTVATIDASGYVTGLTGGTAIITYTATVCGSVLTANMTITVNAFTGISGNVIFTSPYFGNVKVWLITYNPSTLDLEAVDSVTNYCSSTSVYYQFTGLTTDSFRVKASAIDSAGSITGPIPTYHDTSFYWDSSSVIAYTTGASDINENINMLYGTSTSGPGFISGNVLAGANRGTTTTVPVVGMHMVVLNTSTGTISGMAFTDASGNYTFSNLPYGTYTIFPDSVNYATTPFTGITLSAASPTFSTATFTQHTLSKTITPGSTTILNQVVPAISTVTAFPNPTTGRLNIQWAEKVTETGTVTLSDITGRVEYTTTLNMNEGSGITTIDLSSLTNGLYMINIKSASLNYNNKVEIMH